MDDLRPEAGAPDNRRVPAWLRKHVVAVCTALVGLGLAAFAIAWAPQHLRRPGGDMRRQTLRLVDAVAVTEASGSDVMVPGELMTTKRAALDAPATGYVRHLSADVGDHVRAGQILADLDTPDTDEQLAVARTSLALREAARNQIEASGRYAQAIAMRQASAVAQKFIAPQGAENANLQAGVLNAIAASMRADIQDERERIRRLETLVPTRAVTAPFDGLITRRLVVVGALVRADAGTLFEIEVDDPLVVLFQAPQAFGAGLYPGAPVEVVVQERAGRRFAGRVTHVGLNPASRMLDASVVVQNGSGELLPGMNCDVVLALATPLHVARVPTSALVFDTGGPHVATVGKRGHVHFIPVRPGRLLGGDVEIIDGLAGGERVLSAPPADVAEGTLVKLRRDGDSGRE